MTNTHCEKEKSFSLIKIGLLVFNSAYFNGTSIGLLIHLALCLSYEQKGVVFHMLSLPKQKVMVLNWGLIPLIPSP